MSEKVPKGWENDRKYNEWVKSLKEKFRQVQLKAAVKVNSELLNFYWELGKEIVEKQKGARWGDKFLERLSRDLMAEFPDVKGFSKRNLEQIRRWFLFWNGYFPIAQQPASQIINVLTSIPWWHNVVIISKCNTPQEALFYVQKTKQ